MSSFFSDLKEQFSSLKFWCLTAVGAVLLVASAASLFHSSGSRPTEVSPSDYEAAPYTPAVSESTLVVSDSEPAAPLTVWTGWQQVRTAAETVLYTSPDETSAPVVTIAADAGCVVTQREDDWALVRRSRHSGWVRYSDLTSGGDVYVADPETPAEPAALSGEHASALASIAKKYKPVGLTLAVIDDGKVAYTYEYGWADKKAKTPMDADTKIRIASVSKVFTTMNALAARDLGALDLDAPVGSVLGYKVVNKKQSNAPVTLRHLMTHTSSLYDLGTDYRIKEGLTRSASFQNVKPGTAKAWRYNNFGAGVVGAVTEKALGVTLLNFSKKHFFTPMDIDAAFHAKAISDRGSIACLYTGSRLYRTVKEQVNRIYHDTPGQNYAPYFGALTISAADMASVLTILINDGQYGGQYYLSPESVAEMETPAFKAGSFEQCLTLRRRADMYDGRTLYYHTGNAQGVRSFASYDKETGDGLVVIATGMNGESKDAYGIYSVCGKIADYCYSNIL